ncbi:MAG: transglycosylase SLT domain-containing protein [Deltaproteobacteria bacterium]|nr:transglycosylase SLT domain-containing protein [Deltaproteobacteria bacterium]
MDTKSLNSFPQVAVREFKIKLRPRMESEKYFEIPNQPLQKASLSNSFEVFDKVPVKEQPLRMDFQEISAENLGGPQAQVVKRLSQTEVAELLKMPYEQRKESVRQLLKTHLVETNLMKWKPTLLGMIKAESNFNPSAVSADGFESKGLFQLLDTTGATVRERINDKSKYNPFDPVQNIRYGVSYFDYLHKIFRNGSDLGHGLQTFPAVNDEEAEKFAIAAFNAGEGRVAHAQKLAQKKGLNPGLYDDVEEYLPKITIKYVKDVLNYRQNFDIQNTGPKFAKDAS